MEIFFDPLSEKSGEAFSPWEIATGIGRCRYRGASMPLQHFRLIAVLAMVAFASMPTRADVLFVDCVAPPPLPPKTYPTINDAVNAASSGDTLLVRSGACPPTQIISRDRLVLVAGDGTLPTLDVGAGVAGIGNPIPGMVGISGSPGMTCVEVLGSRDIEIIGFEIENCDTGVHVIDSNRVRLHKNFMVQEGNGVLIENSYNVHVVGNVLFDVQTSPRSLVSTGISLLGTSARARILDNEVEAFTKGIVVDIRNAKDFLLGNNLVHASQQEGISIGANDQGRVLRNTVINNWASSPPPPLRYEIEAQLPASVHLCIAGNDTGGGGITPVPCLYDNI